MSALKITFELNEAKARESAARMGAVDFWPSVREASRFKTLVRDDQQERVIASYHMEGYRIVRIDTAASSSQQPPRPAAPGEIR